MQKKDYVLGTDPVEIERLRRQHELWAMQARDIWTRAGFESRQKILDLGCGPGFTTLELARFIGPRGDLTGVDASDRFLQHLRARAQAEVPDVSIKTVQTDITELELPSTDYDAAYCRWLMIFVPDVEKALQALHRHLKPGAPFALQEYAAYETMQVCPEVPMMEKILKGIFKSWMDEGGHPNRGRELPYLLEKNGFRVKELRPVARIARPHEPLWDWPTGFFASYLPKLVQLGFLTAQEEAEFHQIWKAAGEFPGRYFFAPTVIDIIAERV